MDPKQVSYWLAGILLAVGAVCYAAFPVEAPEEPVRLMYSECVAGKVLFTHKAHTEDYDISCETCHHPHPEDEEAGESLGCRACHVVPEDGSMPMESCTDCHEDGDFELAEVMLKPADALHAQCIGCHKEGDAGPQDCGACHIKHSF